MPGDLRLLSRSLWRAAEVTSGSRARASRLSAHNRRIPGPARLRFLCCAMASRVLCETHGAKKNEVSLSWASRACGVSDETCYASQDVMNRRIDRHQFKVEQADLAQDGRVVPVDPFAGDLVIAELHDRRPW